MGPVVRLHPARQQPEPELQTSTNYNTSKMPTKNIIVVSGPSLAASRSRRGGTDKNYSLWGGSATVVTPDGSNGDVILAELECVPSVVKYKVNTENTARPGRANKRKAEEEVLDPEEDEKRKVRRNRNRLAAARCRQKRLDQIETLQVEVNNWELKNRSLEEEVIALKAEKEELQYILAAHRNTCSLQVKLEPVVEEESPVFVQVQSSQEPVKPQRPERPGSLSLTPLTVNNIEGVAIDTPSNGILSFNTLLEGRTG